MDSINRIRAWVSLGALAGILGAGSVGCASEPFRGFRTDDGFGIVADLTLPEGSRRVPVVVAGHQLHRDRRSWDPLLPSLRALGFAVLTFDHRGFGESTAEAASPAELNEQDRLQMHREYLDAIEALGAHPRIDTTRVVLLASGLSVGPAVQCAQERGGAAALILFPGAMDNAALDFLTSRGDLPVLLLLAGGDARGAGVMRRYGERLTGPAQELMEFPPMPDDPADWIGTDGLAAGHGVVETITWFLERNVPVEPGP